MYKDDNKKIQQEVDSIDILGILKKAFYHWPLFLVVGILSFIASRIYLRYNFPVYITRAKIYIKDQSKSSLSSSVEDFAFTNGGTVVENEMELVKSPLIIEDVIKEGKFNIHYYIKGKVANQELYEFSPITVTALSDSSKTGNHRFSIELANNDVPFVYVLDESSKDSRRLIANRFGQPFFLQKDKFMLSYNPNLNRNRDKNFEIAIDSISTLAYKKADEITTNPINRASVFELTYEDEIPKRSADFLNRLLDTYNRYTLSDKNRITLNIIKFIDTRLQSLGVELNLLERDVETFKKTRGITEIGENAKLYLDQVRDADAQLDQSKIQLSVFDQVERYVNNPDNAAPFTPGSIDAPLANMIGRYEELMAEKRRKSLSAEPSNPIFENLNLQITDTKNTIKNYIAGFRRNAITENQGLQRKANKVEELIREVPTYEREFINIKRQQGVKEQLYLYLLQKKEESEVSYASTIVDNKVISPAYIPTTPIRPKRTIILIVFIFGGFVITSIYISLKYLLNNKINLKKDIESITNIPVIAEIFDYKEEIYNRKLSVTDRGPLTEQILNLRNNLKFLLSNITASPVILVTSSIPGEGKTFLSSRLAKALTYNNKRVVMLELDLRKPALSKSLGVNNSTGITNYLINDQAIDNLIIPVAETDRLFIIPSGPVPPNPIELIESEKMLELIVILKQRFDFIVIDTSPLGMVTDAKSLASYIDCALFVVRFNYTIKQKFKEVIENMDTLIFKRLGIIFNGVDPSSSLSSYGYGYNQYSYGYGDSAIAGKKKFSLSSLKLIRKRFV